MPQAKKSTFQMSAILELIYTIDSGAVVCTAVHCSSVQCSAVQCSAVQCEAMSPAPVPPQSSYSWAPLTSTHSAAAEGQVPAVVLSQVYTL